MPRGGIIAGGTCCGKPPCSPLDPDGYRGAAREELVPLWTDPWVAIPLAVGDGAAAAYAGQAVRAVIGKRPLPPIA